MKSCPLNLFSTLSILLLIAVGRSSAQTPQRDNRPRAASIGGRVTVGGAPAANALVTVAEVDPQSGGAWFGAEFLLAIVLVSSLVGAVIGGTMLLVGKLAHKDVPISFGPFLAGAGLVCLVAGQGQIVAWLPFAFPFHP